MKSFDYVITESLGIQPQTAGTLCKIARVYKSAIIVHCGEKASNVLRLMAMLQMGIKCGDRVTVTIQGPDEEIAAIKIEDFFKANL